MEGVQSIGQLLDGLGLKAHLDDGDLISGAVVLLEVVGADGNVMVEVIEDDGTSWVRRIGLLKIALATALTEFTGHSDDDDD